jgi:hypothetical protein
MPDELPAAADMTASAALGAADHRMYRAKRARGAPVGS